MADSGHSTPNPEAADASWAPPTSTPHISEDEQRTVMVEVPGLPPNLFGDAQPATPDNAPTSATPASGAHSAPEDDNVNVDEPAAEERTTVLSPDVVAAAMRIHNASQDDDNQATTIVPPPDIDPPTTALSGPIHTNTVVPPPGDTARSLLESPTAAIPVLSDHDVDQATTLIPPPPSEDDNQATTIVPPPAPADDDNQATTIVPPPPPPAPASEDNQATTIVPPPAPDNQATTIVPQYGQAPNSYEEISISGIEGSEVSWHAYLPQGQYGGALPEYPTPEPAPMPPAAPPEAPAPTSGMGATPPPTSATPHSGENAPFAPYLPPSSSVPASGPPIGEQTSAPPAQWGSTPIQPPFAGFTGPAQPVPHMPTAPAEQSNPAGQMPPPMPMPNPGQPGQDTASGSFAPQGGAPNPAFPPMGTQPPFGQTPDAPFPTSGAAAPGPAPTFNEPPFGLTPPPGPAPGFPTGPNQPGPGPAFAGPPSAPPFNNPAPQGEMPNPMGAGAPWPASPPPQQPQPPIVENSQAAEPVPFAPTPLPPDAIATSVPGAVPTAEEFAARRAHKPTQPEAQEGLPALVRKLSFGLLSPAMTKKEKQSREAIATVRRNFGGLRQVTVVNPKGGAGKTVAVLMTAMTFGQARGGYVLAWDNNETQGTLGMRAQPDFHSHTVRDVLHSLEKFSGAGGKVGDLTSFVRSQGGAMFDVLASDESATAGEMLTANAFNEIRTIVDRFYKLMIVDTGNNVRAENWQASIDATDQLIVTMSARGDSAETAARMLDHLEQTGRAELARNAVTVVSMPATRKGLDLPAIERHFQARTRAVLFAPYERLLDSGEPIRYDELSRASREAWLTITAAVAEGL